ncbi:caspase family protein [Clostridium sartagoforme]|uniref:Caspase domain-containing protein n=1 Tax=Clostridium sartagoforme AAU1 TaxID=1202534 RepID=R9BUQ7_9CLOT|nr:caspase family protein [Clostridium sartagoforme]EOR20425.1 Caspase domain-containing protein [Clostridium sartagoforme AAU1]
MSTVKSLLIGVSDYSMMNENNLPFCINDISAMSEALTKGLKAEASNIIACGDNGIVTKSNFLDSLKKAISTVKPEDTFIFYFSGHGGNSEIGHLLLLSDGYIMTQEVIELFESIPAKNKIIIFDSCMAGNFEVVETPIFSQTMLLDDFVGKGYAVISSCNATQYSYGHPNKPVSLFTSFLCEALKDRYIIREGKKSLNDIQKLLFLYLSIWNKNNHKRIQNPIYRANLGGTIYFSVEDYTSYKIKNFYEETEKYTIYSVKPLHSSIAKRYSARIILKEPLSFEEIAQINHEVVEKLKMEEFYNNSKSELYWKGKPANIVFCYFGRDEQDMINNNYICHTTWVDNSQDKEWWYKLYNNCEVIKNIHFNVHTYYDTLKTFNEENIGEKNLLYKKTTMIVKNIVTLAESAISLYNEFINNSKTEIELIQDMEILIPHIEKWYFFETELELPPKELKKWCQCCSSLVSTIHDFTFFYNQRYIDGRTSENRIACMNMTIKRYYDDLEKLKIEEQTLTLHDKI